MLRDLGYPEPPADTSWDFGSDAYRRRHLAHLRPSQRDFRALQAAGLGAMVFRYRQSPQVLAPSGLIGVVDELNPAPSHPGEVALLQDDRGRLLSLTVVPPRNDELSAAAGAPRWDALFAAARLDPNMFRAVASRYLPVVAFDVRAAWEGTLGGEPVRVEAAAHRGRPVFFRLVASWEEARLLDRAGRTGLQGFQAALWAAFIVVINIAFVVLARRNLRAGRGDRRGARRLAAVAFVAHFIAYVSIRHWVLDGNYIFKAYLVVVGIPLCSGLTAWLSYVGIEPFVRRRWPHLLIAWARLIEGQWRNPLVGRAVLIGVLVGIANMWLQDAPAALFAWLDRPGLAPFPAIGLGQPAEVPWILLSWIAVAILWTLATTALLLVFTVVLRREVLAYAGVAVFLALTLANEGPFAAQLLAALLMGTLLVVTMRTAGLLAFAVQWLVMQWMTNLTLTADPSRWYFGRSALVLALVLGLALYGFRVALGRQPAFATGALDA